MKDIAFPTPRRFRAGRSLFAGLLGAVLLAACESAGPSAPDQEGVDFDEVFAPATSAEIAVVAADWSARRPTAADVLERSRSPILAAGAAADLVVFSHRVEGLQHFGAAVVPSVPTGTELPVLVYAHPGDSGVSLAEIQLVLLLLGDMADDLILVVPSFRSEPLALGTTYTSQGDPSPWDRDVDDAIALLDVVLQQVPAADPERIAVAGFSRGAGVALLMGARDSRIDGVVEIAGPTDFFGDYARAIVEEASFGILRALPGLVYLHITFIQPLLDGEITIEDFRFELVRRSPVLFADRLPPVQVHHGTTDDIVAVSQAQRLDLVLSGLPGRADDEVYLYPGIGHDPSQMAELGPRIGSFLRRIWGI